MIVNLCQFSQPLREALPAPLTEVRHDVLYEAVSIFLLVRQQLQRINQMSAKALRYCMRPEDLGLVNTFACLHHQEPVWLFPIIFFSTDRTPPFRDFHSHSPLFRARKPCFIILCVQSVSLHHFICSKNSLAGGASCH